MITWSLDHLITKEKKLMDKKQFKNLIDVLDKIIVAYSKLKDLFEEKKETLKKSKPDDLGVLDNKILALNNEITKLNEERKNLAVEMLGKDTNMSGFIEFATNEAPEYVNALEERKVKICKIIPELVLLNQQNVELLKHGIIISNKMLETIIDAFAPQGCNYNGAGKTDAHEYDMWTINEEV